VEIVGQRNEETAQLFGNGLNPAVAAAAEPVQVATVAPAAAPDAETNGKAGAGSAVPAATSMVAAR